MSPVSSVNHVPGSYRSDWAPACAGATQYRSANSIAHRISPPPQPSPTEREGAHLFGLEVSRFAARLLQQAYALDPHAAIRRFAHVVDREEADRDSRERLHFDT